MFQKTTLCKWTILAAVLTSGCFNVPAPPPKAKAKPAQKSILKQKTQEIAEFDPKAGRKVHDLKNNATNPITGALEVYGPTIGRISTSHIEQAVRFFEVEHERYPSYEEFMSQIIKNEKGQIRLPMLPGKWEYQYDVENHKLVVVYPEEDGEAE